MKLNRREEAAEALTAARNLNKKNFCAAGMVCINVKVDDKAVAVLERAMAIDANNFPIQYRRRPAYGNASLR